MKIEVDPDCSDLHAKNIVDMYKPLKTPLINIRETESLEEARDILEKMMHDAINLAFYKGHGKLDIEIENDVLHILDENDRRLCKKQSELEEIKEWKGR